MNVSFKADLQGLPKSGNQEFISDVFKKITEKDTKHTMILEPNKDKSGRDVFTLKKNDVKTAELATEFTRELAENSDTLTIQKLLKIFNMLKIYEAKAVIKAGQENKANKAKEAAFLADKN